MTLLTIPSLDGELYPSLGAGVCAWIEAHLIFGPGDLRGEPARLSDEKRALIYRMYEVYPRGAVDEAGVSIEGRRRFKRCAISLRKGLAKSELAAWLAAVELHPEGPVRTVDWTADGQPVGGPVRDPYIPMVAYTEEQSDELAYYALMVVLAEGPVARDFDIGLQRIMRRTGDGKAVSLAAAPSARDGARTTFQVADETHRWTLPRLREAHRTMLANLPKRRLADPWALEVTTAPALGEDSVAEQTMAYARAVDAGKIEDSRLFFYHREAGEQHNLATSAGLRAAILEASGADAEWSDIDAIAQQWQDPAADRTYLERTWLNRPRAGSAGAFDAARWAELARPGYEVTPGALITLGFDGARYNDSTALVGTEIATGHQWVVGLWERPLHLEDWAVPEPEVEATVTEAFRRWNVWRAYCDPFLWETVIARWAGLYGDRRVIEWRTNRLQAAAAACGAYASAISAGELSHSGDAAFARHIGAAIRRMTSFRDDRGERLWTLAKERPDSPHKIDLAMAAVLSWEARTDALTAGALMEPPPSVYETRGVLSV